MNDSAARLPEPNAILGPRRGKEVVHLLVGLDGMLQVCHTSIETLPAMHIGIHSTASSARLGCPVMHGTDGPSLSFTQSRAQQAGIFGRSPRALSKATQQAGAHVRPS